MAKVRVSLNNGQTTYLEFENVLGKKKSNVQLYVIDRIFSKAKDIEELSNIINKEFFKQPENIKGIIIEARTKSPKIIFDDKTTAKVATIFYENERIKEKEDLIDKLQKCDELKEFINYLIKSAATDYDFFVGELKSLDISVRNFQKNSNNEYNPNKNKQRLIMELQNSARYIYELEQKSEILKDIQSSRNVIYDALSDYSVYRYAYELKQKLEKRKKVEQQSVIEKKTTNKSDKKQVPGQYNLFDYDAFSKANSTIQTGTVSKPLVKKEEIVDETSNNYQNDLETEYFDNWDIPADCEEDEDRGNNYENRNL